MNSISVSVIIPAYNASLYLEPAINSVLAQTFRDFEIIVVDDGSTDDTPAVAQKFEDSIHYIRQDNRGLSAARNTGIRNSQAAVIALLDSDDLWEPEFLEIMLDLFDQHPEAVGVYCGFRYINSQGEIVGEPSLKVVPPKEFHNTQVFLGNWLAPCAVLFRRNLAEQVGLFDETLRAVEDADLWIRLSVLHPFVGLPQALVRYRRHDSNMTKDPLRMVTAQYQVTQKIFGPPEGDSSSWAKPKVDGYIKHFRSAASRYLASGNAKKSAYYLQKLSSISPEYFFSLEIWRRLVRAHIPDEFQFDPSFQIDWKRASSDIETLIAELIQSDSVVAGKTSFSHSRTKSSAYLALADEAGRNGKFLKTLGWLLKALFFSPQIMFSRSYWGTAWRSVDSKVSK